jgi:hypothetical protein
MGFSMKIWAWVVLQPNLCRASGGEYQKQNRVDVIRELVDPANADENFIKIKFLQNQKMHSILQLWTSYKLL